MMTMFGGGVFGGGVFGWGAAWPAARSAVLPVHPIKARRVILACCDMLTSPAWPAGERTRYDTTGKLSQRKIVAVSIRRTRGDSGSGRRGIGPRGRPSHDAADRHGFGSGRRRR